MISAGLTYLATRLALAAALAADPSPATSEATCDAAWDRQSDSWHDCRTALEEWRLTHDVTGMALPDPTRPGQSYVTRPHTAPGY